MESVKEVIQDSVSYKPLPDVEKGLNNIRRFLLKNEILLKAADPMNDFPGFSYGPDDFDSLDDFKLFKKLKQYLKGVGPKEHLGIPWIKKTPERSFKYKYIGHVNLHKEEKPKTESYELTGYHLDPGFKRQTLLPGWMQGTDLKTKGWTWCNEFSTKMEIVNFYKKRGPYGYGYDPEDLDLNKYYSYTLGNAKWKKYKTLIRSPKTFSYEKVDGYYKAKEFKDVFNIKLCRVCGKPLRKNRSGRKYHKSCRELNDNHKGAIRNRRKTLVNDQMGTVSVRSRSFLSHLKYQKINKKDSLMDCKRTYNMDIKELYGEGVWSEPERLISKGINLYDDFDVNRCLDCLKENKNCFPGAECAFPIPENRLKCEECGGKLEDFKRSSIPTKKEELGSIGSYHFSSGENDFGKIGANVVYCVKCGLIYNENGLKSYPTVDSKDYGGA